MSWWFRPLVALDLAHMFTDDPKAGLALFLSFLVMLDRRVWWVWGT